MCDLRHLVQNCTFFVQLSFMGGVFNIFFENLFFLVLQWLKRKSANLIFLSKKVQKSKNVYISYFNRTLKFKKIESQRTSNLQLLKRQWSVWKPTKKKLNYHFLNEPEAEVKEFKPRLKYGWFYLKLY